MHHSAPRPRLLGVPLGLVAVTTALVTGATGAGAPGLAGAPPFAVGHQLSLDDSAPVMQPVHTAAGVQMVAARPGAAGTSAQEVWAYGHADAPDAGPIGGHSVFQQHTGSGWVVTGPPVLDDGVTAFDAERAQGLSVAPNGEGWAVLKSPRGAGTQDAYVFVHHLPGAPGGAWRLDRVSSDQLDQLRIAGNADSIRLSVGSDGAGTYGYAVLFNSQQRAGSWPGAFMRLGPDGHWAVDANDGTNAQGQPANAQGQAAGAVAAVAVDPSSRDAWAVGSAFAVQLDSCSSSAPTEYSACLRNAEAVLTQSPGSVVYHHRSGGWAAVPTGSPASINGLQSATAVAPDGHGGAWIAGDTGSTLPVRGQVDPTQAPVAPFVLHMDGGEQQAGLYCASGCTGRFPLGDGDVSVLATAPPSGADGGDVFLAGPKPSVLYHLHLPDGGGGFQQEPVTVGPIASMAMFSGSEGWTATSTAASDIPLLGHLTRSPEAPQARRWPAPPAGQFAAVAEDPSGSGAVMAVGSGGIWRLDPGTGLWSGMPMPPGSDMPRSISWPTAGFAVAAGGRTILQFDGTSWHRAPVEGAIGGDLTSVAALGSPLAPAGAPSSAGTPPPPSSAPTTLVSQLVGWGGNGLGQLGLGTTVNAHSPAAALLSGSVIALSAGGDIQPGCPKCKPTAAHTLAIACPCNAQHTAGTVYAWGSNDAAQLGVAPSPPILKPQPVKFPDATLQFVAVAAGGRHSLALDSNGHVWAWGAAAQGQLGDGSALTASSPTPAEVLTQDRSTPLHAGAIAAGYQFSMAIDTSNTVQWWGYMGPDGGQAPRSPLPTQLSGLSGATQLAAGRNFGVALAACQAGDKCAANGQELYAWGVQATGSFVTPCVATAGINPTSWCPPEPLEYQQDAQHQPLNVSAIAAGNVDFDLPATHNLGTLVVAGGQLWDVSGNSGSVSPDPTFRAPAYQVPGLANVVSAAVGGSFTLAEELDGSLWALGNNPEGQLGTDPQVADVSLHVPLRVAGVVSHGPIAAGADQALAFADAFTSVPGSSGTAPGPDPGAPGPVSAPGAQAWAVGVGGTAVRFDGARWSVQPSPVQLTLASVTATAHDFVAVGYGATILVDAGRGWTRAPTPAILGYSASGQSEPAYPRLYAAAGLADGTVLLGGEYGTLLRRDPGDASTAFRLVAPSVSGSIHAIAMHRDPGGRLRLLVSTGWVGGTQLPKPEQTALDYSGWLMSGDGSQWRDADLSHALVSEQFVGGRAQPYDELPVQRDAVHGVVLDPSGLSGWAVGDNGSAWRVALNQDSPGLPDYHPDGAPASPMSGTAAVTTDPSAVGSFAFDANMGCVQGTCADTLGWGTRGDVVSLESLRAIDTAARSGALGLMLAGGDLRRSGDESLNAMPGLLNSLSIPVYAAIGAKDLNAPATGGTCAGGNNANAMWRKAFKNQARPWGATGAYPSSISGVAVPGASAQACDGASTHYAFDWHGGTGTIRFVVLDTSQGAGGDADPTNQSPQESEISWLTGVLQIPNSPPTVVVMNQPVICNPNASANDNAVQGLLTTAAGAAHLAGVVASAQPGNWGCTLPGTGIPVYMFGAGGGAFETSTMMSGSKAMDPQHGDYFAWQALSVVGDANGNPTLRARSMPVLESVALSAPQGTAAVRGNAIRFAGSGRIPDMGRVDQTEVPYNASTPARIGFPFVPATDPSDPSGHVVAPDYRFSSDDISVVAPVAVDGAGRPVLDRAGQTSLDPTSGTFCTFRPGSTTIHLVAGTVTARLPVTVSAGSGTQCGPLAPPPPPPVKVVAPKVVVAPQPAQPHPVPPGPAAVIAPAPPHIARGHAPPQPVGAMVPPPAEVVPAPPGGGGVGQSAGQKEKEEESEAAMENANMTALRPHRSATDDWLPLGAAGAATALAAYCIARGRRRRAWPVRAAVVSLGDRPSRD